MSNWSVTETPEGIVVSDRSRQYAFVRLSLSDVQDTAWEGRGDCVAFVGESTSVHYINSKKLTHVPDAYLDAVIDRGYTILQYVNGGWDHWDGRPEWSESYIDLSNAEEYDPEADTETEADDA